MMRLLVNDLIGDAWDVSAVVEDWDCIYIGILEGRMATMLGKAFPQSCFIFVEWSNEFRDLVGIFVVDIGEKVMMRYRNAG